MKSVLKISPDMSNILRAFLICSLTCAFINFNSCKRPEGSEVARQKGPDPFSKETEGVATNEPEIPGVPVAPVIKFPFNRILKDSAGREIDAEILGKMDGSIALRRVLDKKRFVIPLEKLSDEDQVFFTTIPEGKYLLIDEMTNESPKIGALKRFSVWLEDFEEAKKRAREQELPIYILFTGSSWNLPCQDLDRKVLSTSKFKEFAKKKMILLKYDFPRGDSIANNEERDKLAKKYNVTSYPTIFITDADGNVWATEEGYEEEKVEDYIAKMETFIKVGISRILGIPSE